MRVSVPHHHPVETTFVPLLLKELHIVLKARVAEDRFDLLPLEVREAWQQRSEILARLSHLLAEELVYEKEPKTDEIAGGRRMELYARYRTVQISECSSDIPPAEGPDEFARHK
jgi:hypothetical protein